jgi:predicted DNA-binding protein
MCYPLELMFNIPNRTSLAVFPKTVEDLDVIKKKTGATKKWIVKELVEKELKRAQKKDGIMEAVVK